MHIKGKKGSESLRDATIQLVIFLALAMVLFSVYNSILNDTYFFKEYYSKDTALLIDSMHSGQGNITFNYKFEVLENPLEMHVVKGRVEFYDYTSGSVETQIPVFYLYAQDVNISVDLMGVVPREIEFKKRGNVISFDVEEVVADE